MPTAAVHRPYKHDVRVHEGPLAVQWSRLMSALDVVEARSRRTGAHRVQGVMALAGVLTRATLEDSRAACATDAPPLVYSSEEATIKYGAFRVYTDRGARSRGSAHADQYVYVPFMSRRGHNPCIMKIVHLFLIRLPGMGWPDDEARIAIGTLFDRLAVREGVGLEGTYNDDPAAGACVVPRMLFASRARMLAGYTYAIFLNQINCPVAHLRGSTGSTFITITKMGYHGRLDHERS